jgi:hypothetical protein
MCVIFNWWNLRENEVIVNSHLNKINKYYLNVDKLNTIGYNNCI